MKTFFNYAAIGAVVLGVAGPAFAHHSAAAFNTQQTVTVTGTAPGVGEYQSAYDLNEPFIVDRLEKLGERLRIIIDDSVEIEHGERKGHGAPGSPGRSARVRSTERP